MIKVIGARDPRDPTAINTTSSSKTWSRGLSPFLIGPCKMYGGIVSRNMENAWQYSKVYSQHVDVDGNPNAEWVEWSTKGFAKETADRYPMGKGAKPVYSYWDGKKLDYILARKLIYLPLYADAVMQTEAFEILKKEYQEKKNITLWDYDGYDYLALGMTLKDVLNNSERTMGHAFILAMLLEVIVDGKRKSEGSI